MLAVIAVPVAADPVQFEDVSSKLGFERGTETWGLAWGNLNGDKWPDLWNSGHRDYPRLYRNTGDGDFDDVSAEYDAQMDDWWMILTQRDVHGGAWGDVDKDGDDDLIVGDENEFFINHADSGGYFERSTKTTSQAFSAWIPTSDGTGLISERSCEGNYVQFIDIDANGRLDKICADADNFPEHGSDPASALVPLIGNVGDSIAGDFNNDLRQDLVAVRGALRPIGASIIDPHSIDIWFRETIGAEVRFAAEGKVTFLIDGEGGGAYLDAHVMELHSEGSSAGTARGIDVFYDNGYWRVLDSSSGNRNQHYIRVRAEGLVDELTISGHENRDLPAGVSHAVNKSGGFEWVYNTGLTTPVHCNSVTTADFDNDMDLDLYLACGGGVSNTPNLYYDNQGDGTFRLVEAHGGEGPVGAGYDFGVPESVVSGDYDLDGFVDLAVANGILFYPFGFGGPDTLIRNTGNDNHWIQIDLRGVTSNGNGIGAKVYVTAGGVTQLREQNGGYHRWSQDLQRIHVGLAGYSSVDEIRIEWPAGAVDVYNDVAADRLYEAVENASLDPVDPGPAVQTTILPGEECGMPEYRITYGPVIQLWRDCDTDNWHLQMRSGLGRMTEHASLASRGAVVADRAFADARAVSPGKQDFVHEQEGVLSFIVNVQDETAPASGVEFSTSGQSRACLWFAERDIEAVIVGHAGKRLDPPFDLANGFNACDNDGDTIPDQHDSDDDNDGVADSQDAFPVDAFESRDSDGDGVGDNTDQFPGNPAEWRDSDADGVGDNAERDFDNDGLTDLVEAPDERPVQWQSPVFSIGGGGGQSTHTFDLSALPVDIGDTVRLARIAADGDLNNFNEYFGLSINSGEFSSSYLRTGYRCYESLVAVTDDIDAVVSVVDIGGRVPGLVISGQTSSSVSDVCSFDGMRFQLTVTTPPLTSLDQDGDGVDNGRDLDSDNDGIADVVEAGLTDSDNNFIVDDLLLQQGTISSAPDSDADGIPDFLDLESFNPRNDGTDYDIERSGYAALDTSGDGFLSALDAGGGTDVDKDGVDKLIDADDSLRGSTFVNTLPVASSGYVTTTVNDPVAFSLRATDTDPQPLSYRVTRAPAHGQLSGVAPHLVYKPDAGYRGTDSLVFVANDGYGDSLPAEISIQVNDPDVALGGWLGHIGGVTTSGNRISYSGAPAGWANNTVRSVPISTFGFDAAFEFRVTVDSDPAATTWVIGLGVEELSDSWDDVDFGLRSSDGRLTVYEAGTWLADGPELAQGDVLSIHVDHGAIEFRHNNVTVIATTYSGSPDFYVDTSFKSGTIQLTAVLAGVTERVAPEVPPPAAATKSSGGGGSVGFLSLLGLLCLGCRNARCRLPAIPHISVRFLLSNRTLCKPKSLLAAAARTLGIKTAA